MANQNNNLSEKVINELSEKVINELKNILNSQNNIVIDCNNGKCEKNSDYYCCLGLYYQYFIGCNDLSKKYLLMVVNRGNVEAMCRLADFYISMPNHDLLLINDLLLIYDLMKKYYLMAIDKGRYTASSAVAMLKLGLYYFEIEKNYALANKYFLQVIGIGHRTSNVMCNLGLYYEIVKKGYNLMEFYYLESTKRGDYQAMKILDNIYTKGYQTIDIDRLRNYLFAIIEGYFRLKGINIFCIKNEKHEHRLITLFCEIIDHNNLHLGDFKYCTGKIIEYLDFGKYCIKLKNIQHFMEYIGKLYYGKNKKKIMHKEYIKNKLESINSVSQIFMEDMDFHYYKYLEIKYAPRGSKYNEAEGEFISLVNVREQHNDKNNDKVNDNDNNNCKDTDGNIDIDGNIDMD
jgi:hypothetical protein